jgi:hypothetical protein
MPKTRQKAKGIGRKMPKRSTRAKPPAPSIEDLKASIIKLADGVEDLMAKRPRSCCGMTWRGSGTIRRKSMPGSMKP